MICGEKTKTAGGNVRAPSMDIYLEWIVNAWSSLSNEIITKSFKVCGISNAIDGSEDDQIHCFKPEGQCPNGRTLLLDAMVDEDVDLTRVMGEIDLDQYLENGCESDYSVEL